MGFIKANKQQLCMVGLGVVLFYVSAYYVADGGGAPEWFRFVTSILAFAVGVIFVMFPFIEETWDASSLTNNKEDE